MIKFTLINEIQARVVFVTQFDPITPFPGAQAVANLSGDKAVLMRQNGFGVSILLQIAGVRIILNATYTLAYLQCSTLGVH